MNTDADGLTRLRRAFATTPPADVPRADCPPASRIWEGARGELAPAQFREVIRHVASCTVCTEAWRLAEKLEEDSGGGHAANPEETPDPPRSFPISGFSPSWAAGVAAAMVVLAIGLNPRDSGDHIAVLRAPPSGDEIELLNQEPCRRDGCVLRWRKLEKAESYNLRVTLATDFMSPLVEESGLKKSEFPIPLAALAELSPGAKLAVRIEAIHPMAGESNAGTFYFIVQ